MEALRGMLERPSRLTGVGAVLAAIAIAGLTLASHASADVAGDKTCGGQKSYAWMGDSVAASITIPSLSHPDGIASYEGTILRPADLVASPGPRPLVALAHGSVVRPCARSASRAPAARCSSRGTYRRPARQSRPKSCQKFVNCNAVQRASDDLSSRSSSR